MTRPASRFSFLAVLFVLLLALPRASYALNGPDVLPTEGQEALKADYSKWVNVWTKLLKGEPVDLSNPQHQQAIDAASKYAADQLTWGIEREPGKISDVFREFNNILESIHNGKEKTQKTGELFIKGVIVHAAEVMKTNKPVSRVNGARLLARIVDQGQNETQADVASRLAGTNATDLAAVLTTAIKDPEQIDAVRYWVFRSLRYLLATTPPLLPRANEETALEAVVQFLKDRNKDFPPGTPPAQIDGYRLVRREAIAALAQGRYPTLPDKSRPALWLLKITANDGILPAPRLDERVEAAIGVAHIQPDLDKDYQPDYAAYYLGMFATDFAARYAQAQQGAVAEASVPWKVDASRLDDALAQMKAQAKNAYVSKIVDETVRLLTNIENGAAANPFDLQQALRSQAAPSQELYKGDAASVVGAAKPKDATAPVKPDESKEK